MIILAFKRTKAAGEIIEGRGKKNEKDDSRTDRYYAEGEIRSFINPD